MKEPIIDEHFFFKGDTLNYLQTWDYINCKDTPRNFIFNQSNKFNHN